MVRIAILDLYNGEPNQGMRCIQDILEGYERVEYSIFDVRQKDQLPGLEFDIYISTGGPGHPLEGNGVWEVRYAKWLDAIWDWNLQTAVPKKHVFFICHSFQIVIDHFNLGKITKRKSQSFGTFPCHKTDENEPLFDPLPNPFHIADFRDYQVVQPNWRKIEKMGAKIIALEKIRSHIPLERAIMAIRLSPEMIATQFHPEADPKAMLWHFMEESKRQHLIKEHGEEKYYRLIDDLRDRKKIKLTHDTILAGFLKRAIAVVNNPIVNYLS